MTCQKWSLQLDIEKIRHKLQTLQLFWTDIAIISVDWNLLAGKCLMVLSSTWSLEVHVLKVQLYKNILTTRHATTRLFVPFCSAQDGESTDMNYLYSECITEMAKFCTNCQVYNKGILSFFHKNELLISLECEVDSEWNDVINFVVASSVAELLIQRNPKNPAFNLLTPHDNISTTVHATTKSFAPFCSAQDGESTDMNCLVFWAHCKNGDFWWNIKS